MLKPIINVHTHIFSYKDVPPFIARCFLPWPFYLATYFPMIFWFVNIWKNLYEPLRNIKGMHRKFIGLVKSSFLTYGLYVILLFFLAVNSIYYILDWSEVDPSDTKGGDIIQLLIDHRIVFPTASNIAKSIIIAVTFISSQWLRTILVKVARALFKPFSYLPNKKSLEFINRYYKIAIIANYKHQRTAYNKLYKMYPSGSKFVILTMDMTYMNSTPPRDYYQQLDEITDLIDSGNINYQNMIPFLFVDPRRIQKEIDFFKWEFQNGKISLLDCKVKHYLEDGPFRGIKIYPALGYFPFEESLLPLWLYCVQHDIPVTTHCTVGTIFYRRKMKAKWFTHPVFRDREGKPMELYARRNIDLQINFTHPLNYLVLLESYFLKEYLAGCSMKIQDIFGYTSSDADLVRDLSKLKINIAHYGGIDQWQKHLDSDRLEYAQEIMEMPEVGIRLATQQSNEHNFLPDKPADVWVKADWYSIISSMMLQYENVYADISYILHSQDIEALLNLTLENPRLCKKVLFGTDYYVVRNHKSEKEIYADMMNAFSGSQLDLIARENPNKFLKIRGETMDLL